MKRAAFGLLLLVVSTDAEAAQAPGRRGAPLNPRAVVSRGDTDQRAAGWEDRNARETRERLSQILDQYPPSLREVLRLDPSLLTNDAYLAPYPALAAFLAQHPQVAHNPAF